MTEQQTRTAIVTGAARGIGAAIARRLSQDGFAVAVLDLDESACKPVVDEIETAGGKALAVGVDVADEQAVEAAVSRVADELGAPTVLVNNAGITRDNLLFKLTVDDWNSVMDVHLRGAFLMSRATQKYMTEARWGRIVNLSSVSALGNRGQANYAAAKAGVQGFTKTLAIEARQVRSDGERDRTRVHRDGDDRADRGAGGDAVRGLQGSSRQGDPGGAGGPARGHRCDGVVLRSRRGLLRDGPGRLRGGWAHGMRVFDGIAEFEGAVGEHLGVSEWHTVTQEQIDLFADATGDHQWIHVDPHKAAKGPFGSTVAHGYLTVSLIPRLGHGDLRGPRACGWPSTTARTRSGSPRRFRRTRASGPPPTWWQ